MIIKICKNCGKEFKTYPCRVGKFCSYHCNSQFNWPNNGKESAYKKGHKQSPEVVAKRIEGATGSNHSSWKGDDVSYRGLHQWIRRHKGIPLKCFKCGSKKSIQWANIYHLRTRDLNDYIEMCASCHKLFDLHH